MIRIYFFQKRNPRDGTLMEEYEDCQDEKQARNYYNNTRFFKYIGWSDGRFMMDVRSKIGRLKVDKDKLPRDHTKAQKEIIREGQKNELEFARENTDKSPPRDLRSRKVAMAAAEREFDLKGRE